MAVDTWMTFTEVGTNRSITLLFGSGGVCAIKEFRNDETGENYALLSTASGQEWGVNDCALRLSQVFCDDEAG